MSVWKKDALVQKEKSEKKLKGMMEGAGGSRKRAEKIF